MWLQKNYDKNFPTSFLLLLLDPGSGMDKIKIRDKHSGSTTTLKIHQKLNDFLIWSCALIKRDFFMAQILQEWWRVPTVPCSVPAWLSPGFISDSTRWVVGHFRALSYEHVLLLHQFLLGYYRVIHPAAGIISLLCQFSFERFCHGEGQGCVTRIRSIYMYRFKIYKSAGPNKVFIIILQVDYFLLSHFLILKSGVRFTISRQKILKQKVKKTILESLVIVRMIRQFHFSYCFYLFI